MARVTDIKYIEGILEHNPLEKVFPITDKANFGVKLDTWEKFLQSKFIPYCRSALVYRGSGRLGEQITLDKEQKLS